MELLIVGAGAVGSVYGFFASRNIEGAGARVTYLVKPKHRADKENGITLYSWKGRKADTIRFNEFKLIDETAALRKRKFDAVLITLPSDQFRANGWFEGFLKDLNIGSPKAKIWSLPPGERDPAFLLEKLGPGSEGRVVYGSIPIMSYLAPLPGEAFTETGYAFYIPPGSKAGWSSKDPLAAESAHALFNAGGLPSKTLPNIQTTPEKILGAAILRLIVAGLERSEWSFDRFMNGENIHLVSAAIREMTALSAKYEKTSDPLVKRWAKFATSVFGLKTIIRFSRFLIPFDFEAFMRVHFTKVDAQMHLTLDEQIEYGKRNGISTTNLVLLRGRRKTNNPDQSQKSSLTLPIL